jgi:hypothetical protein
MCVSGFFKAMINDESFPILRTMNNYIDLLQCLPTGSIIVGSLVPEIGSPLCQQHLDIVPFGKKCETKLWALDGSDRSRDTQENSLLLSRNGRWR